jgi:5-carboxymethyl-2-hydroxymuconate isomerase
MASMHLGVTLQIDVGAEVFDAKHSNLHPLFNKPDSKPE